MSNPKPRLYFWIFAVLVTVAVVLGALFAFGQQARIDTAQALAKYRQSVIENQRVAYDNLLAEYTQVTRDCYDANDCETDTIPPALIPDVQDVEGQRGPTGEAGSRGERGDMGLPGQTGPAGLPGKDGSAGADGSPGADGASGTNGADGGPGPVGPQGPVGPAGADAPTVISIQCLDDGTSGQFTFSDMSIIVVPNMCQTAPIIPELPTPEEAIP